VQWELITSQPNNSDTGYSVGDQFEITLKATDISTSSIDQSTFSAYTDLHYNPQLLRAIDITHDPDFPLFRSGSIDNTSGLILSLIHI